MAQILKQSTAVDVLIGPFLDLTDAATAETGESPSVKLSKNGQTLAAKNDVTTPVHDADGYYNCELDATDTNTVGTMVLTVAKSATALPVRHEYQVIEEAIYDALFGASAAGFDANQRVDVGKWLGTAVTTSATSTKPQVDVFSISDDATAADNLEASMETLLVGTATGGSQSSVTSAVTGHGDDTFIGRVLLFRTGTLQYESGVITDYDSTTGTFTFGAATFTAAPTTETFVIV